MSKIVTGKGKILIMKKLINFYFFKIVCILFTTLFSSNCWANSNEEIDLTVVSSIDFNGSVRRHAIGLIDCLHDELSINFIASREVTLEDVPSHVQNVIISDNKRAGNVALLEDPLYFSNYLPESYIKIAFSVFESTIIPSEWVNILNSKFDSVVVADPYYIKIYKECGVNIPIFHIPLGIYIEELLEKPLKSKANDPFIFCCCSRFFPRKNHQLLIDAFVQEFGNQDNVILKLNGGAHKAGNYEKVKKMVSDANVSNIIVTDEAFAWKDYMEYISNMDCHINISKGEGFSITPREALALGIPTIITNNTAQKTICNSGFARVVPSNIKIPTKFGFQFDCKKKAVRNALRDVYENYDKYLKIAHDGREWVKQYLWKNLKKKYLNLIKPKDIRLGKKNIITDEYIMTNSPTLYEKYLRLLQNDFELIK